MQLEVILLDKEPRKFKNLVAKQARQLAKFLPKNGSMEVYLISSRRMQALNRRFRGKNKSTNVLSFQKPRGFPGVKLGEVYIDPVYIKKRGEDLDLMLVHGVLHILGYDHERKSDRIKMERKEAQLLFKISNS